VQKSRARKVLEEALAKAPDAKKPELATRLTNLIEKESRNRARSQRIRARAKKEQPAASPPTDGAELFTLYTPEEQAAIDAANAVNRAKQAEAAEAQRVLGILPDVPEAPAASEPKPPRPVLPPNGAGWTRTLTEWEPATWWDQRSACWVGASETGAVRGQRPDYTPESPELFGQLERTGRLTFEGGEFVNEAAKKRAEDAAFRAYADKVYGR
jgi:hypothetical protein